MYHAVPARIAINMILNCSAGGIISVAIACQAQLRYQTDSMNANEISNGVLSYLVAASCPFVEYWQACLIGSGSYVWLLYTIYPFPVVIAVMFYHFGCHAEYKCDRICENVHSSHIHFFNFEDS